MPNYHINHPDFESATLISVYPTLTPLASAGYYAVDNSYRYWNGNSFDTQGLEACTSFASVEKPYPLAETIKSINVRSKVKTSGANADAADPDNVPTVGFVWGKSSDFPNNAQPTLLTANTSYTSFSNKSVGEYFSFNIDNLLRDTQYIIRAYATNGAGTSYSQYLKKSTDNSYLHDLCVGSNAVQACTSCTVFYQVLGCQTVDGSGTITGGYPQPCNQTVSGGGSPGSCSQKTATSGTVYWGDVGDDGTIRDGTVLYSDVDKTNYIPSGEYYYGQVMGGQSITVGSNGAVTDVDACDC